jgi:hypothetical protein
MRAVLAAVLVLVWSLWLPAHMAFEHHCGVKGECAVGIGHGHGHGHGEGDQPHPWHPAEAHAFEGLAIAKRPVDDVPPTLLGHTMAAFAPLAPQAIAECRPRAVRAGRPLPTPPSRGPPAA